VALGLTLAATTHPLLAADDNNAAPNNTKAPAEAKASDDSPVMEMSPIEVRGAPAKSYVAPVASTGTKTDTPLMETPMSIQVVPQQVLQDQKILSLDQALSNVSGVNAWSGLGTQENYTIRGFYTTTTLRDGVRVSEYSTTGGSTVGGVNMTDVESVEVLKGPAAILYGRVDK
jgi:iron complex outermembrane receptor protein